MHVVVPLLIAAALFGIGVYAVLARRNAILVLMGVELMLNAANLLLVTFDVWWRDSIQAGQSLALFVITIAAAEIGLGLAIVLLVFRTLSTVELDEMSTLGDDDDGPDFDADPAAPVGRPAVAQQADPAAATTGRAPVTPPRGRP
jgi:NADH-quinone oxidoreductase subunit K